MWCDGAVKPVSLSVGPCGDGSRRRRGGKRGSGWGRRYLENILLWFRSNRAICPMQPNTAPVDPETCFGEEGIWRTSLSYEWHAVRTFMDNAYICSFIKCMMGKMGEKNPHRSCRWMKVRKIWRTGCLNQGNFQWQDRLVLPLKVSPNIINNSVLTS